MNSSASNVMDINNIHQRVFLSGINQVSRFVTCGLSRDDQIQNIGAVLLPFILA